ncbi:hypothetical protein AB4225_23285 [Streptomyces sp. 2RAF24]|uniref:hypothetical protein n=1 Tax=unclassified Streptomyces TaxID=2593676 RepID=UPI0033E06ACF
MHLFSPTARSSARRTAVRTGGTDRHWKPTATGDDHRTMAGGSSGKALDPPLPDHLAARHP